ncbi:MAG: YeeE/YedE family protein [Alphaproteobacteria bacterium]|nr:YeeE/YedE family protein [Alphaproteobacteria bacterium]
MINPAKVLSFLDVAGHWDPTLAFVMAGALAVTVPGFAWLRARNVSVFGGELKLPTRRDIDHRLVIGAVLFGVGWGLAGFCPGPALAALSTGLPDVFAFVVAMVAGMLVFRLLSRRA